MAEPEGEDPPGRHSDPHVDRTEAVATVALLWVSIVALLDAVFGGKFGLIGFLAIGPFIAAAFAGPDARRWSASTPPSSPSF